MSNMSNLDIVLSEHKLSDAQKNAVVELLSPESGYITAKPNTLKSLERKGLVTSYAGGGWQLADEFRAELNLKTRVEESIESLLQGDPWKLGDAIAEDEAHIILDSDAEGTKFDKFDSMWDDVFKITAGFGATLDWRGTEVWNGLTAAEIKEDMDSATPVNRKARRTHFRTLRNAFRRQTVQRPRKALKITGKVGV